jgi:hypothetical protein
MKHTTVKRNHKKNTEKSFFNSETRSEKPAVLRRKLTRIDNDSATTGNVLGYFYNSTGVTSCTEWAGLAASYDEYRVRGIRVRLCPVLAETVVSPPTAAAFTGAYPGPVASANYANGTGAGTFSALWAQDGSRLHGCNAQMMEQIVSWDLNPTAKLWTAIASAIPADGQIGVEYIGSTAAVVAINGAVTHLAFVEMDVEFRGRN